MLCFYLSLYCCSNISTELSNYEKEIIRFQIYEISGNIDLYKTSISNALSILNLQANHASELLKIYTTNSVRIFENDFSDTLEIIFLNAKKSLHFLIKLENYLSENMNDLYYNINLIENLYDKAILKEKAKTVLYFKKDIFYDMISQFDINLKNIFFSLVQCRSSINFQNPHMQLYIKIYLIKHSDIYKIIEIYKIHFLNVIGCSKDFYNLLN